MTRVQLNYDLTGALDEAGMASISKAHSVFGMLRVQPAGEGLRVEFDASRLSVADVDGVLQRLGLPVRRRA